MCYYQKTVTNDTICLLCPQNKKDGGPMDDCERHRTPFTKVENNF